MANYADGDSRRLDPTQSGGSFREPPSSWFDPVMQEWVPFAEGDPVVSNNGPMPGGGGSGAGVPSFLGPAVTALSPFLARAFTGGGGSGSGMSPDLQRQIAELLEFQKRRLSRSEPLHEAAMRLASSFGQTGSNPRLQQQAQVSQTPGASRTPDPLVLEAVARLMGRG